LTGEPLIYATMGTLQNRVANVFHTIAAATSRLKDVQLVLSLGEHVDPKKVGPLPKSAITVHSAPQLELLKRASVCITHAGLNTVLEALAQGVSEVAIPVTNDQPGVGARIAAKHEHSPSDPPGEPHSHRHRHAWLRHAHPHYPDIHHRHEH
jgi:zeaxanthin glucosyltransferase